MNETREQWLEAATVALSRDLFTAYKVPPVKVSCGWPSTRATSTRNRRIGECWRTTHATDSTNHVFISPAVDDPTEVLAILAHELIHAIDDCEHGHRAPFKRIALTIGLTGKMTATTAGPDLASKLTTLAATLGPYPHGALTPGNGRRKQTTRLVKAACVECGYTVRTTRKWLETMGAPLCPCNSQPMAHEHE